MNKGLAALERIGKNKYQTTVANITGFERITISVKQDNKKDYQIIEKELQALEIIGEKRVQLDTLFSIFTYHKEKENSIQLTLYNSCVGFAERKLTQAQFDLLKEVLL